MDKSYNDLPMTLDVDSDEECYHNTPQTRLSSNERQNFSLQSDSQATVSDHGPADFSVPQQEPVDASGNNSQGQQDQVIEQEQGNFNPQPDSQATVSDHGTADVSVPQPEPVDASGNNSQGQQVPKRKKKKKKYMQTKKKRMEKRKQKMQKKHDQRRNLLSAPGNMQDRAMGVFPEAHLHFD